jgi:hypothetical protein
VEEEDRVRDCPSSGKVQGALGQGALGQGALGQGEHQLHTAGGRWAITTDHSQTDSLLRLLLLLTWKATYRVVGVDPTR